MIPDCTTGLEIVTPEGNIPIILSADGKTAVSSDGKKFYTVDPREGNEAKFEQYLNFYQTADKDAFGVKQTLNKCDNNLLVVSMPEMARWNGFAEAMKDENCPPRHVTIDGVRYDTGSKDFQKNFTVRKLEKVRNCSSFFAWRRVFESTGLDPTLNGFVAKSHRPADVSNSCNAQLVIYTKAGGRKDVNFSGDVKHFADTARAVVEAFHKVHAHELVLGEGAKSIGISKEGTPVSITLYGISQVKHSTSKTDIRDDLIAAIKTLQGRLPRRHPVAGKLEQFIQSAESRTEWTAETQIEWEAFLNDLPHEVPAPAASPAEALSQAVTATRDRLEKKRLTSEVFPINSRMRLRHVPEECVLVHEVVAKCGDRSFSMYTGNDSPREEALNWRAMYLELSRIEGIRQYLYPITFLESVNGKAKWHIAIFFEQNSRYRRLQRTVNLERIEAVNTVAANCVRMLKEFHGMGIVGMRPDMVLVDTTKDFAVQIVNMAELRVVPAVTEVDRQTDIGTFAGRLAVLTEAGSADDPNLPEPFKAFLAANKNMANFDYDHWIREFSK